MVAAFEPMLQRLIDRGVFAIDDTRAAIWLLGSLITEPLHTQLLMGVLPSDLNNKVQHQVDNGVAVFMKLYAV